MLRRNTLVAFQIGMLIYHAILSCVHWRIENQRHSAATKVSVSVSCDGTIMNLLITSCDHPLASLSLNEPQNASTVASTPVTFALANEPLGCRCRSSSSIPPL